MGFSVLNSRRIRFLNSLIGLNTILIVHVAGTVYKLLLALIMVSLLFRLLRYGTFTHFRIRWSLCSLFLFVVWNLLSIAWSEYDIGVNLYVVLLYTFFAAALFYYYLNSTRIIWDFFKSIVFAGIVFSGFLICYYGFSAMTGRMEYAFVSVNRIGTLLAQAGYMALFVYCVEKKTRHFAALILISTVCLWTGSRTGLLMLLSAAVVFFFLKEKKLLVKVRNALIIVLVVIAVFEIIMNVPALYQAAGIRFEKVIQYIRGTNTSHVGGDASTSMRLEFIQSGWEGFLRNPILGYGTDQYRYTHISYSHSNLIELLYNGGIVGFLAFYTPYVIMFRKAWRNRKRLGNYRYAVVAGFLTASLIESAFSIYYNDLFNWLCLLAFERFVSLDLSDEALSLGRKPWIACTGSGASPEEKPPVFDDKLSMREC